MKLTQYLEQENQTKVVLAAKEITKLLVPIQSLILSRYLHSLSILFYLSGEITA